MDTGCVLLTQEVCDFHLPLPTSSTILALAKPRFQNPNQTDSFPTSLETSHQ